MPSDNTNLMTKSEFDVNRVPLNLFNNEIHGDTYYVDWNDCLVGKGTELAFTRIKGAFSTEFLTRWKDIIFCRKNIGAFLFKYSRYGFGYGNIYEYKDTQFQFISQQITDYPRVITIDDIDDSDFINDYIIQLVGNTPDMNAALNYMDELLARYNYIAGNSIWNVSENIPLYVKLIFNLNVCSHIDKLFPDRFKAHKFLYTTDSIIRQYEEVIQVIRTVGDFNKDKLENYLAADTFEEFKLSIEKLRDKLTGSGKHIITFMLLEKEN